MVPLALYAQKRFLKTKGCSFGQLPVARVPFAMIFIVLVLQ
jgi:hypothetical protein